MSSILPDLQLEARRVIATAQNQNITLRLLGGLAVSLHSPSASHPALARTYPDLDFALADKQSGRMESLMTELGYSANKQFNLFNGERRLLFYDEAHKRQVDIFVGEFQMCHRLLWGDRLSVEPLTLPLAELLLTKLQIVQINHKDVSDIIALLLDHPFAESDQETINLIPITALCGQDWGWWKTITINITTLEIKSAERNLATEEKTIIADRLQILKESIKQVPKSWQWKLRDKIGERQVWYELPEEVQR